MYTNTYSFKNGVAAGRRTRLRAAGGILVILGAGHSALVARAHRRVIRGWVDRGLVGTVDIGLGKKEPPTLDVLQDRAAFWAGIGSFAAPTVMLGLIALQAAEERTPLPAWLGPAVAVWSGLAGTVMVKAPWPLAALSGVLIASAADPVSR